MMRKHFTRTLLASSVLLAASAQAVDIRLNGFGSIVGTKASFDGDTKQYVVDAPTRGIIDDSFGIDGDSMLALQATADLNDGLQAAVQITGKSGLNYNAEIEWAYLSYAINDELTVQGGRFRLPFYFYSEFLDVGYAYHWVRTPYEVYYSPVASLNGLKAQYNTSFGNVDASFQVFGGNSSEAPDPILGIPLQMHDIVGVSAHFIYNNLQARIMHAQLGLQATDDAHIFENAAQAILDEYGDNTALMAVHALHEVDEYGNHSDELELLTEDDEVDITALALNWNNGTVLLGAEYVILSETENSDGRADALAAAFLGSPAGSPLAGGAESWYVTAGYRIGSIMPHITYTEYEGQDDGALLEFGNITHSQTLSVGVRWDFHPAAALKFQIDQTESDETVFDLPVAPMQPGVGAGDDDVTVYNLAVDFVF